MGVGGQVILGGIAPSTRTAQRAAQTEKTEKRPRAKSKRRNFEARGRCELAPVLWTDGRVHLGHLGHKDRKKTAPLIALAAFILSP